MAERLRREDVLIESAYHRTMAHANRTFRLNLQINIIVVIIGIVILAYSIIYSWVNELNIYSTAFAGIGVAEFIAIFMLNPQKKIQEALANHTQVHVVYDRYLGQRFVITDMYSAYMKGLSSVQLEVPEWEKLVMEGMKKFNDRLNEIGKSALEEIRATTTEKK